MGNCYADGRGVQKDLAEAAKWFRKAAEQDFVPAQVLLSDCYEKGTGVARDQVQAVRWSRKAAEHNFAIAQTALGFYYATGQGVAKDYVEAYKWFSLGATQGQAEAIKKLVIVKNMMTPEQIAEGQQRARDFKPQ